MACSSTPKNVEPPAHTSVQTKSITQKPNPANIYGDEKLNKSYETWASNGYPKASGSGKYDLDGDASWYGPGLNGNKTASGEIFDMYGMTAAHKKLPFGTIVVVTNKKNNKSVVVRINDRGPFTKGRIIDLSYGAAYLIDMVKAGVVPVEVEVIEFPKK